VFVKALI